MKMASWRSSGKQQQKSSKTPKQVRKKKKQFKMMIKKLREGSTMSLPFCSLV